MSHKTDSSGKLLWAILVEICGATGPDLAEYQRLFGASLQWWKSHDHKTETEEFCMGVVSFIADHLNKKGGDSADA